MKILHCADVHLGSKMESRFPKEKADERKIEIRAAFNRMVEYAKDRQIKIIILAGDVFDSDCPLKKDKEFFYSVVKNNPEIDFFYLRGNHDVLQSYTETPDNLKCFSDVWSSYVYGDVVISGIESDGGNRTSMYSSLKLEKDKKNIVILHGQIAGSDGVFKINLSKLRNKNIDYLALGHIHSFSDGKIDDRGKYVYSGCLEGRGFDEVGDKGFVEIDVGSEITYRFVKNSFRTVNEIDVDISDTEDYFGACRKVASFIKCRPADIVRINLVGEISYDADGLDSEMEKQLARSYYLVSVKNRAVRRFDIERIADDLSLRGEFIRTVLASELSDEDKNEVISCGLRALRGEEVE